MKKERGLYLKAFILLLDEILIVGLILFVLWKLGVRIPFWALLSAGAFCAMVYWLLCHLLSAQGEKVPFGRDGMVGLRGKAVTPLNPEGVVRVRGELWKAVSQGGELEPGVEVVVVGLEGPRLLVTPQSLEVHSLD